MYFKYFVIICECAYMFMCVCGGGVSEGACRCMWRPEDSFKHWP